MIHDDKCPQCGQPISPPIKSINRQVCYFCGWSGEVSFQSINKEKHQSKISVFGKIKKLNVPGKTIIGIVALVTCGLASFFIYTKLQTRKAALNAQPTAKEKAALEALKRLNSFLDIGINFSDYSAELREVKAAVDQIDTTSLTKHHFEQAVQGYSLALDWWECNFEYKSSQYDSDSFYGEPKCRDALLPALTDYSETMKKYIAQGIEYNISVYGQDSRTPKTLNWDKNKVLQKLWVEAEYHVEDAEASLHQREKLLQEWWK